MYVNIEFFKIILKYFQLSEVESAYFNGKTSCLLLENIKFGYPKILVLFLKFLEIQTKSSNGQNSWPIFQVLTAENTYCFYLNIGFTGSY